jgi:bifunctional UDP-N-acetylglucosamine pyrophosphorylase/glucosamine-1-phosphate N-acetyltransferase
MSLHIVILAAGQGKRMHSATPKILHCVGGKPMLVRVVETALELSPEKIHVIIGHGGETIKKELNELPVHWVVQAEQLGTGHAVLQALPYISPENKVLVLCADVPLIQAATLKALVDCCDSAGGQRSPLGLMSANMPNPFGLGRILRNQQGEIQAIVEEKDANEQQRKICETYSGICCAPADLMQQWLSKVGRDNAQGEYYLTEIITMAAKEHHPIVSFTSSDSMEVQGVNNRAQLQQIERIWQQRMAQALMLSGVTLADAARIDIRGELNCEQDVFIDVNTIFSGKVHLGTGSKIGPNCVLHNVILGSNSEVLANSVLENCEIGDYCQIGPFARLRPGTILSAHCKIGNFMEIKNSVFGEGSKANHLSYVGDAVVGKYVNIGAGTITCNYDGANKHQTIIEDGAFIGSDTQLIAPVVVGENATIGAGSTLRRNAPPGELTLTESKQKTIYGWSRPSKKKK